MYLKLNNINLNYTTFGHSDFNIVAQVCNSKMSYERSVLVRNSNELMCWFGYEFEELSYFSELLNKGVTLFLTSPMSPEPTTNLPEYIDYKSWKKTGESDIESVYRKDGVYIIDGKELVYDGSNLVEHTDTSLLVLNGFTQLPEKGEKEKIYVKVDHTYWIWLDNYSTWTNIDELPQNIDNFKSGSLDNRDTLIIYDDWTYSTPEFVNPVNKSLKCSLVGLDYKKVIEGYQTLAFIIDSKESELPKDGDYIILPNQNSEGVLIYFGQLPQKVDHRYYPGGAINITIDENWRDSLTSIFKSIGYNTEGDKLFCTRPTDVTYFYNMPDKFSMKESFLLTQDLIENNINRPVATKFWSKTVGNGGSGGDIFITFYPEGMVEVCRFNYSEVYLEEKDVDLVSRINNESKLVYCEGSIKFPDETRTIVLRGSSPLSKPTTESYRISLETLINEGEIKPDFILINSLSDYGITETTSDYWNTLLGYAELCDCQVLIQNTREDYKINYIGDNKNRLVFFFDSMLVENLPRPGYYVFLESILNNLYSIPTSKIIYKSPIFDSNEDLDNGGLTIYEKDLETRKSNYLIDNGLSYFYKYLQDGKDPESSILMRFVLGKIARQLHKSLWGMVAERSYNLVQSLITGELRRIVDSYSFIKSIKVKEIDMNGETLLVSLETTISDLVKNHVSLDIEINYNKF